MARNGRISLGHTIYYRKSSHQYSGWISSFLKLTDFETGAGSRAHARYKLPPPELVGLTKPQATGKVKSKFYIGCFDDKMTE
jgi:hypothetical protein